MKKILFTFLLLAVTTVALAQEEDDAPQPSGIQLSTIDIQPFIGYLSYDAALEAMPQKALVEAQMAEQTKKFEAEMKRVEKDFNQKYESFLEGQRDFPRTILLKRQTELQQLLQQNIEFKQKAQAELKKAHEEAMAPLRQLLAETIAAVAHDKGLILVVNTDSNACPFIEPEKSLNIQEDVVSRLNSED